MSRRSRFALAVLAIVCVAVALRSVPLYWSPHPSTLDGFRYAAQARDTIAVGHFPLAEFRADNFVYAGLLAITGLVLDTRPLGLAQPLAALTGGLGCLLAMAVAGRVAGQFDWRPRRIRAATLLLGVLVAVEGLYLRRTSVTDEELLAIAVLPGLVLALHLALVTGRRRWLAVAATVLLAFPFLHTFSTLVAALTITALWIAHAVRSPDRRTLLVAGGIVGGFWAYFVAYYTVAAGTALTVPYVDRVTAYPGLFVAWVIVLVIGVAWFWTTTGRARAGVAVLAILACFGVVAVNAVRPVFPGTAATPPVILALVAPIAIPALAASRAVPWVSLRRPATAMVLALFAAPAVQIGFSLSASLTPEYFGTVMRAQTFLQVPALVLAALALTRWAPLDDDTPGETGRDTLRVGLVALVVTATALSAPIAFVTLDTGTVPSTTLDSEFRGVEVAAGSAGPWATDHSLSRVGTHYFDADVAVGPTASWLNGGPAPDCPAISQQSWTTTGAHLFPAGPATVSPAAYDRWLDRRHLVYANTGRDPVVLSRPRKAATC